MDVSFIQRSIKLNFHLKKKPGTTRFLSKINKRDYSIKIQQTGALIKNL